MIADAKGRFYGLKGGAETCFRRGVGCAAAPQGFGGTPTTAGKKPLIF